MTMRIEINPFPGTKVAPDVQVKGIGSPFKRDGKVIGHIIGYRVRDENLILILEVDEDAARRLELGRGDNPVAEDRTDASPEGSPSVPE